MYEVWKYDGNYIQGENLTPDGVSDLEEAKEIAQEIEFFEYFEESVLSEDVHLWISNDTGSPIGLIIKIE